MTSPVFRPNQPVSSTWAPAGGWYNAGAASSSSGGGTVRASGSAEPGSQEDLDKWNQYIQQIQDALKASSGFQRTQLEAQMKDAQKARENAYKIAQLQSETSRYGVDVGRQNLLDQLKEQARQYDANHDLEIQKFGFEKEKFGQEFGLEQQKHNLNVANAYTSYAQTPDQIWALNDFKSAMGRAGQGQAPMAVSANPSQPKAKTWEDFAALAGGLGQYSDGSSGGSTTPGVGSGAGSGGVADVYSTQGGPDASLNDGAGAGPDPREKAVRAVMQAMPPSQDTGHDEQDYAALGAIRNLYFAGRPGEVERLGAQRRKTAQAGLARLGYDPNLVEEDRRRSLPKQASVRAY